MDQYSGYLLIINEAQRAGLIEEYIESGNNFTETLSAPDWKIGRTDLFFLAFDQENIRYAALSHRGHRVATQKYQVRFSHFVEFEPAIPITQIGRQLRASVRQYFIRSTSGMGSHIPPGTWQDLVRVIKQLRPNNVSDLERLEKLRLLGPELFRKPGFEVVSHERDAVNIALRMSGFNHNEILNWQPSDDKLAPFLAGLSSVILREDQMINHDAQVFGDWDKIRTYQVGAIVFEQGQERLTVINVNRHKIEETLGVDLLYYFHNYKSYVMVQYKRMTPMDGTLGFRPTDGTYESELQRMHEFERSFRLYEPNTAAFNYRLHPGVFYFKLCPAKIIEITSTEMIHGMYIPLDYWDILVNCSTTDGPRGGKCITYDNVGRYLNNTFFVDLAKGGWIGSRVNEKEVLSKIIQDSLQGKKSVILASKAKVII